MGHGLPFRGLLSGGPARGRHAGRVDALDRVESLEETLSHFRPTSEIARLNRLAAHGGVEVDADLFALLSLALKAADTGGAYDITSVPLWEAWGFARRAGQLPQQSQLADARSRVGSYSSSSTPNGGRFAFFVPACRLT